MDELNIQQQRWVLRVSPPEIVEKIHSGQIRMEALERFARANSQFAIKFASVQEAFRTIPNPVEIEDFDRAVEKYNADPESDQTLDVLTDYVEKWRANESAREHINAIREYIDHITERRDFDALRPLVEQALAKFDEDGSLPSRDVSAMISQYLANWRGCLIADLNHIRQAEEWNERITTISAATIDREWQNILLPDGTLTSFENLRDFMARYPGNSHSVEADDLLWEWALRQDNPEQAVQMYDRFTCGGGRHSAEVDNMAAATRQWNDILRTAPSARFPESNLAVRIIEFIQQNPSHIYNARALETVRDMSAKIYAEIKENPIEFYPILFEKLYNSNCLPQDELMQAANANDYLLGRILDRNRIQSNLDNLHLDEIMGKMLHGVGEKGITDILFFGISSSGKTCILSGLLNNDNLSFDNVNFSCRYAQALRTYAEEGFAPPATRDVTVAVIKASSNDGKNTYHFNLVDMAGEAFVQKIADHQEDKTDFSDMGQGAPEVLGSQNEKVFFIVVDPCAKPDDQILQRNVLRRLIGLFFGGVNGEITNRSIMERVRGIHFIVSKADKLSEPRLENARDIIYRLLNDQERNSLVENCRQFGINASNDTNLNGKPRIFCFSLGKFSIANTYDYNRNDSDIIIQTIRDYCSGIRRTGVMHNFRAFLTDSLISNG